MSRKETGFSLVELLVVLAILLLLVAILLPSLRGARQLAGTMECTTHLHAMGRAAYLYAADNKGYVPRDFWYDPDVGSAGVGDYAHYFFAWCLSPYVGGPVMPRSYMSGDDEMYAVFRKMPIYRCPSMADKAYVLTYAANGVDYVLFARSGSYNSGAASRIDRLPGSPSDIAYLCEIDPGNVSSRSFGLYDFFSPAHFTFWNGKPNPTGRMIRYNDRRHAGRTTLAYFDGRAGTRTLAAAEFPNRLVNPLEK